MRFHIHAEGSPGLLSLSSKMPKPEAHTKQSWLGPSTFRPEEKMLFTWKAIHNGLGKLTLKQANAFT